jgi:hypothetical protein
MTDALKQATGWPGADQRSHVMRRYVTSATQPHYDDRSYPGPDRPDLDVPGLPGLDREAAHNGGDARLCPDEVRPHSVK